MVMSDKLMTLLNKWEQASQWELAYNTYHSWQAAREQGNKHMGDSIGAKQAGERPELVERSRAAGEGARGEAQQHWEDLHGMRVEMRQMTELVREEFPQFCDAMPQVDLAKERQDCGELAASVRTVKAAIDEAERPVKETKPAKKTRKKAEPST